MTDHDGIAFRIELRFAAPRYCLRCGTTLFHIGHTLAVRAAGEWIGELGDCCLNDEQRQLIATADERIRA